MIFHTLPADWVPLVNGELDRFGNAYYGFLLYTPVAAQSVGTDADDNSRYLDDDARHAIITCEGGDGYYCFGETASATRGNVIKDGVPLIINNNPALLKSMSIISASGTFKIATFK